MGVDSCCSSQECIQSRSTAWGARQGLRGPFHSCSELWLTLRRTMTVGPSQSYALVTCFSCPSFPVAAVSPVLDCGYCLIGGMKVTRFLCKNVGFSVGRFCVMPKKSWPPPSFRVSDHKLLPGKRAAPTKEITPCEGLAGARLWLETHGKQNFRTSLCNCHNPSGNETQCVGKQALQFWLFH